MRRISIVDTVIEKDGKILMVKRNFFPKDKLDFPGGFVGENETIEEAAIRETKEETGLQVRLLDKLGSFDYYDRGDKTAHVFLGEITRGSMSASIEGQPLWIDPAQVKERDLAFPQVHWQVLQEFLAKDKT